MNPFSLLATALWRTTSLIDRMITRFGAPLATEDDLDEIAAEMDRLAPFVEEFFDLREAEDFLSTLDYLEAEGFIVIDQEGKMSLVEEEAVDEPRA